MINEEDYEIEFEDSDDEGDNAIDKKVNEARKLNDRKFLNIIIPTSEAGREKKKIKISEDQDIEVRRMAFEKFMDDYSKKMNLEDRVEHNTEVVKTQEELKKLIKDFVEENQAGYGKLFINLMCHGSEDGKISTYGPRLSNDHYIKFLNKLASDENVPIQAIMGQCHGYKFDEQNITMGGNLSVYATTNKDKSRVALDRQYKFSSTLEINGQEVKKVVGVKWAKHEGYTKYVTDEVIPPNILAPILATGRSYHKSNKPPTNLSGTDADDEITSLSDRLKKI